MTESTRWDRLQELFRNALELEPTQRAAFLDEACGDDRELRREVEELIDEHTKLGEFLEKPAVQTTVAELIDEHIARERTSQPAGELAPRRRMPAVALGCACAVLCVALLSILLNATSKHARREAEMIHEIQRARVRVAEHVLELGEIQETRLADYGRAIATYERALEELDRAEDRIALRPDTERGEIGNKADLRLRLLLRLARSLQKLTRFADAKARRDEALERFRALELEGDMEARREVEAYAAFLDSCGREDAARAIRDELAARTDR